MEEIKVGEYVRTANGQIAKLIEPTVYEMANGECIEWLENITKHSFNIIDLIEIGDYVNGYKVICVTLDPAPSGKCVDIDCDKPSYESYLFEEQIYSIVTKEQFAQIEYRLED